VSFTIPNGIGELSPAPPGQAAVPGPDVAWLASSGSYLVASQTTTDFHDEASAASGVQAVQRAGVPFQSRTASDFADLAFTGLKLVPPGLVPVSEWRPETEAGLIPPPAEVGYIGAVARKP
jgi:hypothetical protein